MSASVVARNLRKRFGDVVALDDVSLEVYGGQVAIILGPNGSGKSTLLRAVAGMITPDAGTMTIGTHDAVRERRRASAAVGSVIDSARCWYPRLSGRANLEFHARVRGLARGGAATEAARELAAVGLEADAERAVGAYSAGMRARLALARARIGDPAVLVLDEPTASLDARSVEDVHRRILEGDRGRTVLLATHDVEEGARLGTMALVLDRGRIVHRLDSNFAAGALRSALVAS